MADRSTAGNAAWLCRLYSGPAASVSAQQRIVHGRQSAQALRAGRAHQPAGLPAQLPGQVARAAGRAPPRLVSGRPVQRLRPGGPGGGSRRVLIGFPLSPRQEITERRHFPRDTGPSQSFSRYPLCLVHRFCLLFPRWGIYRTDRQSAGNQLPNSAPRAAAAARQPGKFGGLPAPFALTYGPFPGDPLRYAPRALYRATTRCGCRREGVSA
jgi:hypothetical protein